MEYGERPLPFRKARSWATRRPCSSHFREARAENRESGNLLMTLPPV